MLILNRVNRFSTHPDIWSWGGGSSALLPAAPGLRYYMTASMDELMQEELQQYTRRSDKAAGFLPCVKQLANVASLPGIVKWSIGLPVRWRAPAAWSPHQRERMHCDPETAGRGGVNGGLSGPF